VLQILHGLERGVLHILFDAENLYKHTAVKIVTLQLKLQHIRKISGNFFLRHCVCNITSKTLDSRVCSLL